MTETLKYKSNSDGTVTVVVKGEEAGTFATREQASDAVDASISAGIQKLAEKVGVGDKVAKILDK